MDVAQRRKCQEPCEKPALSDVDTDGVYRCLEHHQQHVRQHEVDEMLGRQPRDHEREDGSWSDQ
jgi:hypothetical protein